MRCARYPPRVSRAHLPALLALLLAAPAARAQQFFTDVAALPVERGCLLDAWYGQFAAWVQPACRVLPTVELRAGAGWGTRPPPEPLQPSASARAPGWLVQGKIVFRSVQEAPVGIGLVLGLGADRGSQVLGREVQGAHAYVPVSVAVGGSRMALLHGNVGWRFGRARSLEEGTLVGLPYNVHVATWGVRLDVAPVPYAALVGELAGEFPDVPSYQVGLSLSPFPQYVRLRVSYGGTFLERGERPGWAAGLVLTPPSLW